MIDWGLGCFDVLFFWREKPSVFWGKIVWCMSKNFFFLMAGGKNLDAVSLTCKKHLESDPALQDDPWAVRPIGLGAQYPNGSDLVDVV